MAHRSRNGKPEFEARSASPLCNVSQTQVSRSHALSTAMYTKWLTAKPCMRSLSFFILSLSLSPSPCLTRLHRLETAHYYRHRILPQPLRMEHAEHGQDCQHHTIYSVLYYKNIISTNILHTIYSTTIINEHGRLASPWREAPAT